MNETLSIKLLPENFEIKSSWIHLKDLSDSEYSRDRLVELIFQIDQNDPLNSRLENAFVESKHIENMIIKGKNGIYNLVNCDIVGYSRRKDTDFLGKRGDKYSEYEVLTKEIHIAMKDLTSEK